MSRIPITGGFAKLPEGKQVLRIFDVFYDEEFGKLEIHLVNAKGITHRETFSLKNKDESWNEGACNAFSYFAHVALGEFDREDVDPEELIDHYIEADVYYDDPVPSSKDPSKMVSYTRLGDKFHAEGFDEEPVEKAMKLGKGDGFRGKPKDKDKEKEKPKTAPVKADKPKSKDIDLDSLLG